MSGCIPTFTGVPPSSGGLLSNQITAILTGLILQGVVTGPLNNNTIGASMITNVMLQTLTAPGLVANSATSATPNNVPNAIVSRASDGHFDSGNVNISSSPSFSAGLTILTHAAGVQSYLSMGRVSTELEFGVVGTANQFFVNTLPGDVFLVNTNPANSIHLGGTFQRVATLILPAAGNNVQLNGNLQLNLFDSPPNAFPNYAHISIAGGDSLGFLWSNFHSPYGDSINLSYNLVYPDSSAVPQIIGMGGGTSIIALRFSSIIFGVSPTVGTIPTDYMTISSNGLISAINGAQFSGPMNPTTLTASGQISTTSTTPATAPATGALSVAGGASIGSNLLVVGPISTPNLTVFSNPASGSTIFTTGSVPGYVIDAAGTIATLGVRFPPNPLNGQEWRILSNQIVSAISWEDSNGNASGVIGGPASLPVGGAIFTFYTDLSVWVCVATSA